MKKNLQVSIYVFYGRVSPRNGKSFRANGKKLKPNTSLDAEAGRFCLWVKTCVTGDSFDGLLAAVRTLLAKTFSKRLAYIDGWTEIKSSRLCISGFFRKVKHL